MRDNHLVTGGLAAGALIVVFWLGWLARWCWDIRDGGARDQAKADGYAEGNTALTARLAGKPVDPELDAAMRGAQAAAAARGAQAAQDDDWTDTLAAIPAVPPHRPGGRSRLAAGGIPMGPGTLQVPIPGAFHHAKLAELAAGPMLTGPVIIQQEHPACPRCGASRWQTIRKGEAWRCRNCGYERAETGDAGLSQGEAGASPDRGRVGNPEHDHAPVVAGGPRPVAVVLADWDTRAAARLERRATVADQAAAAEFAVWETEIGGLIAGAYDALGFGRPPARQLEPAAPLELHHA